MFVAKVLLRCIYRLGPEVAQLIQCLGNGLDDPDIRVECPEGTVLPDLLRGSSKDTGRIFLRIESWGKCRWLFNLHLVPVLIMCQVYLDSTVYHYDMIPRSTLRQRHFYACILNIYYVRRTNQRQCQAKNFFSSVLLSCLLLCLIRIRQTISLWGPFSSFICDPTALFQVSEHFFFLLCIVLLPSAVHRSASCHCRLSFFVSVSQYHLVRQILCFTAQMASQPLGRASLVELTIK